MAGAKKRYHVLRDEHGEWIVLCEGSTGIIARYPVKEVTVEMARHVASRHRPSQVVVHRRNESFPARLAE